MKRVNQMVFILSGMLFSLIVFPCFHTVSAAQSIREISELAYDLWLPPKYFPTGFELSPDSKPKYNNPLGSNGTQTIEVYVDVPSYEKTNKKAWITVFLDGMRIFKTEEDAEKNIDQYNKTTNSLSGLIPFNYEAKGDTKFMGRDGSVCRDFYSGGRHSAKYLSMRKVFIRYVRIGKLVFGIRVNSYLLEGIRKVNDSNTERYPVKQVLECDQLFEIANDFSSRIQAWAQSQGWLSAMTVTTQPPSGDLSTSPFTGFTTTADSPNKVDTPDTVATATAATGALTVIGSLLMLGASGIRPQDVTEALKEWIGGQVTTEAEAIEDVYPDVDSEDYEEELPEYKNGDTNKDGDVWSDRYGGWVGPEVIEQDRNISAQWEKSKNQAQGEDKRVRDAAEKLSESRKQGKVLNEYFDKRKELDDQVDKLWDQDSQSGNLRGYEKNYLDDIEEYWTGEPYSGDQGENRKHFLDNLTNSADELAQSGDYIGALKRVQGLGDVVKEQMREGYKPTYTYKDAIIDTGVQFGALALDSTGVTMGFASTAAGSGIAMRDAAVDGKSTGEILWSGAKAGAVDFVFGKTTEKLVDVLRVIRGVKVPGGAVVDSGVDLMQNTGRNMNALENSLSVNKNGLKEANLDDVLSIQRKPHQVRNLKQFGTEEMQEGFNNTLRSKVYKPHDEQLLESIRRNNRDLADSNLVVHEFRTPGAKSSNINADRDFRVLSQNKRGDWVEVPRKKWEQDSNEIFGKLTGYDSNKCPKGLSDVDKKAWWAEQHSHTPTDKIHIEASADYSDQVTDVIDIDGQKHGKVIRSQVKKPQIEILKEIANDELIPTGQVKLKDPEQLGSMFDEKIHGSLRRNDPYEAIAQAKKGVKTLDKVRVAYDKQGLLPKGNRLPDRFEKAMDLLRKSNLDARPSAAGLKKLNGQLSDLGFSDLNDFGKKMSGQYESLKYL